MRLTLERVVCSNVLLNSHTYTHKSLISKVVIFYFLLAVPMH